MTITNRVKITISPLRLHAASSVRIPTSTHSFRTLLPTVRIRPLNLFSASSVDLHGTSNTNVLRNNLRVRLSPIKSPVLRKYLIFISVMFHFMFVHYTFSSVWVDEWPPFGK